MMPASVISVERSLSVASRRHGVRASVRMP